MSISAALILVTHLISFLGFTTLALTGQIQIVVILAFYMTLVASFISEQYKKDLYFSQGISNVLAIILLLYVFLSVTFFGEEIFQGILKFLIYIQMLKHLSRKNMRDIMQIYIISFFQFISGAIITIEIAYGLAFIIYIALALLGLILINLRKESLNAGVKSDYEVITRPFVFSTGILSLTVVFMSILLFICLPRLKTGFFSSEFIRPNVLKTGFSDSVELGKVGEIKKDNSAVMRVGILNNNGRKINRDLYWRGIALDRFDGKSWSIDTANYGDYERSYRRNSSGVINILKNQEKIIAQEIVTEPTDTDILFAINYPVSYSEVGRTVYEVNNSYFLPYKPKQRIKYRAYSKLSGASEDELRNAGEDYTYYIRTRYLQLPELSERMKSLALQITNNDSNPRDKVNSIKNYLLREMNYTITLEEGSGEFPLDDFIFEKKEGHCEYFATALVVMLRINGIPSRIVNGFIGGTWNNHGDFYLIKESDAHSWVEVYYPGYGWWTTDPTPSSLDDDTGNIFLVSSIISYIDYLKYRWQRYVIDYSRSDQIKFFSNTKQKLSWNHFVLNKKIKTKLGIGKEALIPVIISVLFFYLLFNSNRIRKILSFNKSELKAVVKLYNNSIKYLSKKGYNKKESQTPLEFAENLIKTDGSKFKLFAVFTQKYMELRYSANQSDSDISELKIYLEKFKKSF